MKSDNRKLISFLAWALSFAAILLCVFLLASCVSEPKTEVASPEKVEIPVASPTQTKQVPTSQAAGKNAVQAPQSAETQQTGVINYSSTRQGLGTGGIIVLVVVAYMLHSPRSKDSILRRAGKLPRRGPPEKK
jgi:outer membrane murein-binding lipoprotein Lpp